MRSTRITPSTAPRERAYLVGITLPRARREDEVQNLAELELLARSAGAEVVGRTLQSRTRIDGTTFVGKGKIEEIAREIQEIEGRLNGIRFAIEGKIRPSAGMAIYCGYTPRGAAPTPVLVLDSDLPGDKRVSVSGTFSFKDGFQYVLNPGR